MAVRLLAAWVVAQSQGLREHWFFEFVTLLSPKNHLTLDVYVVPLP